MSKPTDVDAHVKALHAAYEARTGFTIVLNYQRLTMWYSWCEWSGWTWGEADLARVIAYLRAKIQVNERREGALKFFNLIGHPDTFEEDLQLAKEAAKASQVYRPRKPSPRPDLAPAPDDRITAEDFLKSLNQKP